MKRRLFYTKFASPRYERRWIGRWRWEIRDGLGGITVLASGHTLTERGAHRRIERTLRRCEQLTWTTATDRPVLRPLSEAEACLICALLQHHGVPVDVSLCGVAVVVTPIAELTTEQEVRALTAVLDVTDAPVRWAGVA